MNTWCHRHPLSNKPPPLGLDMPPPPVSTAVATSLAGRLWVIAARDGVVDGLATSAAAVSSRTVLRHCTTVTTVEKRPFGANHPASDGVETRAGGVGAWPCLYHRGFNKKSVSQRT